MKKILIVALVIICVSIASIYLFLKFFGPLKYMSLSDFVHVLRPASESELRNARATFERHYPDRIEGMNILSSALSTFRGNEAEKLKELGVNTISLNSVSRFEKGKYAPKFEMDVISSIVEAKKKGFAAALTVEFAAPEMKNGELIFDGRLPTDLGKHLIEAQKSALHWAKIAEDYKVEYFFPYNELNGHLVQALEEYDEQNVGKISSDWSKEILPKIKDVYKGKVGVKFNIPFTDGYDLTGYDIVGVVVSPVPGIDGSGETLSLDNYRSFLKENLPDVARVARESSAEWIVAEALVEYGPPVFDMTENENGELLDPLQEDYFSLLIEEYRKIVPQGAGIIFTSWKVPGIDIKNRSAEDVVREFFK